MNLKIQFLQTTVKYIALRVVNFLPLNALNAQFFLNKHLSRNPMFGMLAQCAKMADNERNIL